MLSNACLSAISCLFTVRFPHFLDQALKYTVIRHFSSESAIFNRKFQLHTLERQSTRSSIHGVQQVQPEPPSPHPHSYTHLYPSNAAVSLSYIHGQPSLNWYTQTGVTLTARTFNNSLILLMSLLDHNDVKSLYTNLCITCVCCFGIQQFQ